MNTQPAEQVSKAQYNGGSALQDELLDEGGVYSTPYRTYDPALGRFQGVDMLADAYASQTPYQFAGNDPANANDPTGAMVFENGRMVIDDNRGPTSFGFNSSYSYNRDGAAFGGVFHDNGGNLGISIGNFDNMLNFHQNNLDTYEKNKYISIDIYKYVSKGIIHESTWNASITSNTGSNSGKAPSSTRSNRYCKRGSCK